ncbi:hypothetical protein PVA45_07150 (plasmid) [Entomospira entomophila]|uniref:Uncharacterized protein n=1 Tax=Entomospira entomophila TaxID=2719988 RepID=A0A968GBK1_9SPIO|nr:hypothetical protein [Entomospira entomophilus]NIZ41365.1 hypothetical protein [Entomospira entomophilus]WDI36224.1 hypothetical protein PVA45_07150 [Entomospira entomophilus]
MALIQMQNYIEDDEHQSISVELMASWQLWLSSHQSFIRVDSGSNSLHLRRGSFFALTDPFRWYRIVEEDFIITQSFLDVGGNLKENYTYYLYLIDDGHHGQFRISENREVPIGSEPNQVVQVARFRTQSGGIIVPTSLYDSQMQRAFEISHPLDSIIVQYPQEESPEEQMPFLKWQEISDQFAGDFFRVVGGNASKFNSGKQAESVPNVTGAFSTNGIGQYQYSSASGALTNPKGSVHAAGTVNNQFQGTPNIGFDASRSHQAYGRRNEVAPQNQSIRLWKRIG